MLRSPPAFPRPAPAPSTDTPTPPAPRWQLAAELLSPERLVELDVEEAASFGVDVHVGTLESQRVDDDA